MRLSVRLGLALSVLAALFFLWREADEGPNPWRKAEYITGRTLALSDDDREQLLLDIQLAAEQAGFLVPVGLNQPFDPEKLNVYVVDSDSGRDRSYKRGDVRYYPGSDVIVIERHAIWPAYSQADFASVQTRTLEGRSEMVRAWFRFILLHELGHRALHRNALTKSLSEQDYRQIEEEADRFALDKLVALNFTSASEHDGQRALFSRRAMEALPEPDRRIALIASLIQIFSVNLLFSQVAFSSYHSDIAHAAFVNRFRPYLAGAYARASTREGRTFVLLALEYIDRVAAAGENVVAEVTSPFPVEAVSLGSDRLVITHSPDGRQERRSIDLSKITAIAPQSRVMDIMTFTKLDEAGAAEGPAKPQEAAATWWADDPAVPRILDRDTSAKLLTLLGSMYALSEPERAACSVHRGMVEKGRADIVFACHEGFFSATYDPQAASLGDVQFHQRPQRPSRDVRDVLEVMDYRHGGNRHLYLVQNTLSDRPHRHAHELLIWKPGPYDLQLIDRRYLATDLIPTGSTLLDWFTITHPPTLACRPQGAGVFTCVEFLDSIYSFDTAAGRLRTLFYPAGVKMQANENAMFAFYTKGGFRVFVSRPRR